MFTFFDTETTGLPNYNLDLVDPAQPRVLQFAALLTDENGNEVSAFKCPIKPDGWEVDERLEVNGRKTAFAVHGLTNDYLSKYGVSMKTALIMFRMFQNQSQIKIAHNYRFDGFLIKAEHQRIGMDAGPDIEKFCTMKAMTDIMKLPPTDKMVGAGFTWPKSANLGEAYKFCTGKTHEKAHDALADVRACKEVFFWIRNNGLFKDQPRVKPKENPAITQRYDGNFQDDRG